MFLIIKKILIKATIVSVFFLNNVYATTKEELLKLIAISEKQYSIPRNLLLALTKIESNLAIHALNISGQSIVLPDKKSALKTIYNAIAKGIDNIDIGIAQINYKWHKDKFNSIEDMLLPEVNINYAAKLLSELKKEYGDWHKAIRLYHSSRPEYYKQYSRKVVLCWLGIK